MSKPSNEVLGNTLGKFYSHFIDWYPHTPRKACFGQPEANLSHSKITSGTSKGADSYQSMKCQAKNGTLHTCKLIWYEISYIELIYAPEARFVWPRFLTIF